MLIEHLIHIGAGLLWANVFFTSGDGIIIAYTLAAITQAIDIIRMYFFHKNIILSQPPDVREKQLKIFYDGRFYKFSQVYILKVLWYGSVILITAHFAK